MDKDLPSRDLVRKLQREAVAARRVGVGAKCACGESRPEALIAGSNPKICFECQRKKQGRNTMDAHHVAGKNNSAVTVPLPVNDHRAILSPAQFEWPRKTLENSDESPLLAAAACIRGFADTLIYLIETLLLWIPEMLESLNTILSDLLGPKWWLKTDLRQFPPGR